PRVGSVLDTLQQDIQIADRAEPACQASQAALHRSQPRSRKYRDLLQHLKRRPQAPRGDAHIMYALGITVRTGRWRTQPQPAKMPANHVSPDRIEGRVAVEGSLPSQQGQTPLELPQRLRLER